MFWLALAAAAVQPTAPVALNLRDWFHYSDIPRFLYKHGSGFWLVGLRVTVRPDGSVEKCDVTNNSGGLPELGDYTCKLVTERAKFRAAQGSDGWAAFGTYETTYAWKTGNWGTVGMSTPLLQLEARNLPWRIMYSTSVRLMFSVDPQGHLGSCSAEPGPSFENLKNEPQFVAVACDQLMRGITLEPVKNGDGQAVASVQDGLVQFLVDHGKRH